MRIAFPVQEDRGPESSVYGHFGSAPTFIIMDEESGACEAVKNQDATHAHNMCQPVQALGGRPVDAVVVGGIGAGALRKLQAEAIKVYRGVEGSVRENLELIKAGRLPEFPLEMTCAGHQHEGGCHHH